jgi:16S rRNA (cytosine967-C5)-methyltransferase
LSAPGDDADWRGGAGAASRVAPPRPFHVDAVVGLVAASLRERTPADRLINDFFRANRQCGSQDRRIVAEAVYGVLRQAGRLTAGLRAAGVEIGDEPLAPAPWLVAMWFLFVGGVDRRDLPSGIPTMPLGEMRRALTTIDETPPTTAEALANRASLPLWIAEAWLKEYGPDRALSIGLSMLQPAPITLRTNTLRTTRDALAERLRSEGRETVACKSSRDGLSLTRRASLYEVGSFRDGWFEVQDEGSQMIGYLADPRPGQLVVDGCAGGGGKTLHLAALMQNKGMLYAFDVVERRLAELPRRARRADVHNIRLRPVDSNRAREVTRLYGKADVVLVDAPCSGTGVFRRNPDARWKMGDRIDTLVELQRDILDAYVPLLKPGGRLVYATCSMLRRENEDQVASLLERHPRLSLVPVQEVLAKQGCSELSHMLGETLNLAPDLHGTDGFFAAVLTLRA